MKCAVEMGSVAMIYTPNFVKTGPGNQKLIRGIHRHRQQSRLISLPLYLAYFLYFEKMEVDSSDHHAVCVSVYPPINFFQNN
jgi:hypothetical protein